METKDRLILLLKNVLDQDGVTCEEFYKNPFYDEDGVWRKSGFDLNKHVSVTGVFHKNAQITEKCFVAKNGDHAERHVSERSMSDYDFNYDYIYIVVKFKEGKPNLVIDTVVNKIRINESVASGHMQDTTKELSWFDRNIMKMKQFKPIMFTEYKQELKCTITFGDITATISHDEVKQLHKDLLAAEVVIKEKELDKRISQYGK
jgi:hypothetical protein